MNQKTTLKTIAGIAAVSLGLAVSAMAQTATSTDTTPVSRGDSMLGQNYAGVAYDFTHVHDSALDNFNGFSFRYNQALSAGFDFTAGYAWGRSNEVAGVRAHQQEATLGVTIFSDYNGVRPYLEPGLGWAWAKVGGAKDDSFLYYVGAGVEFQVTQPWTVTPYVQFVDATEWAGNTWNFGVKSAYRLTRDWSATVDVSIDDDRNTGFALGAAYHF